jgi:MoaA/NifB/PqqE/SkfB family radical SAM enzyme
MAIKSKLKQAVPQPLKQLFHMLAEPKLKTVFIELTNACNLRCETCHSKHIEGYMSPPLFKKIIDELSEIKPAAVNLHYGGESLLHPKFREFVSYARAKLPSVQLGWLSNGMKFDESVSHLTP